VSLLSAALLFFLVLDPLGNILFFLAVLKNVEKTRWRAVIFRECVIALVVIVIFLFFGKFILELLGISRTALQLLSGIILFLISVKMIFPINEYELTGRVPEGEPFILPLAVPLLAGPSVIGMAVIMTSKDPGRPLFWLAAACIAWLASTVILISSGFLSALLKEKALTAIERLMGLILTTVAVQMFIDGIEMMKK